MVNYLVVIVQILIVCHVTTGRICPKSNMLETTFCGRGSMKTGQFNILNAYSKKDWPEKLICHYMYPNDMYTDFRSLSGKQYDFRTTLQMVEDNPDSNCRSSECPMTGLIFNAKDAFNYDYIKYTSRRSGEFWRKCFSIEMLTDGTASENRDIIPGDLCVQDKDKWTKIAVRVRHNVGFLSVNNKHMTIFGLKSSDTKRKGGVMAKNNVALIRHYYASVWEGKKESAVEKTTQTCDINTGWIEENKFFVVKKTSDLTNHTTVCRARDRKWDKRIRSPTRHAYKSEFSIIPGMYATMTIGIMFNVQDMSNYDFIMLTCPFDCPDDSPHFQAGYHRGAYDLDSGTWYQEDIITLNGTFTQRNDSFVRRTNYRGWEDSPQVYLYAYNHTAAVVFSIPDRYRVDKFVQVVSAPFTTKFQANGKVGLLLETQATQAAFMFASGPRTKIVYHYNNAFDRISETR